MSFTYVIWEISLEFSHTRAPVSRGFLRNELDVQERSLTGPIHVSGCCTANDSR